MNARKRKLLLVLGVVLGLSAAIITVYPLIGNYLSQRNRSLVQTAYTESIRTLSGGQKPALEIRKQRSS